MMAAINSSSVVTVEALSTSIFKVIILPPFWPERPALWFAQAEAIFETAGIVRDQAKYGYVVSQIPERFAAEIADILSAPPVDEKYQTLKTELIGRRTRAILSKEEIGDRKPTEFLAHLRSIGGRSHEMLLRTVFFRRLPAQLQQILSGHTDLPLEKMASLADKILDATTAANNADNRPNRSPSPSSTSSDDKGDIELQDLSRRLDFITRQVSLLTTKFLQSSSSDRGRSQGHFETEMCWYHRRWRNKANKCILPCAWGAPIVKTSGRRT